ncbi:ferredoxin [Paraliomyxa miuraensis]|uniref:ferredoxin n=1 Tax=Paraliomyxa miuraensis TaxID=376150 RepID=UPI0022552E4D|nr:ferredoxin [Paraliomyxa miuraensis]MCX4246986.1 ferredoxin [Paraliomyxa miuraensis]
MKLVVDRDLCEANGVCVRLAPEAFELDDDDVLHLRVVTPTDDAHRARLEAAIRGCPKAALSWEES